MPAKLHTCTSINELGRYTAPGDMASVSLFDSECPSESGCFRIREFWYIPISSRVKEMDDFQAQQQHRSL